MTPDEVSYFESRRIVLDDRVDKMLLPQLETIKVDDLLPSTNQLIRMKDKKRMELLSLESHTLTDGFRKEIDSAARRIHTLIAKSGRQLLDVDIIQQSLSLKNSVLLEALKKLEKLKRIEWVDDSRVILSENLTKISGSTYDVYVEKNHTRSSISYSKWKMAC